MLFAVVFFLAKKRSYIKIKESFLLQEIEFTTLKGGR